ncbi:MAG TPA: hypothetical protein VFJ85_15860 [Acidimicrobiales bacterium]|nr:hypothetical protein [Acidimicrobiales bacterium]
MANLPERRPLTADEAALVLRRAVELGALEQPADADAALVDVGVLEQAAAEVGVPPDAVRRAAAELWAGALAPAPARLAVDQRVLPLTAEQALDRAGRVLRKQLFELRRSEAGRARWRRRVDRGARWQRSFDFGGRVKLSSVEVVTVSAVPIGGAPGSLLRVEAEPVDRRLVVASGTALPAGFVFAGGAFTALLTGNDAFLVAGAAAGAVAGGLGLGVTASWYRRRRLLVDELMGWLLDRVETGP